MFPSLHDFPEVERVDHRQQRTDDLADCLIPQDRLRHQRVLRTTSPAI
jgi:hypothetical protein